MEILESILIPISKLVPNSGQIEGVPKNPRTIKVAAFEKLKASIESDESHLYTNELKVYEHEGKFVVLSGNMRLKACKALKIKQVPCKVIPKDWTIEQICKEVIISNVSSGEWNSEDLANEWDFAPLVDWGVEIVPKWSQGHDINNELTDEDVDLEEEFDPIGNSADIQRVVFLFDGAEEAESYLKSLNVKFVKRNMAWQVSMITPPI